MKTTISIPDPIFKSAEKLAKRLSMSRSQFYSNAVEALIEKHSYSCVTEQLDAVFESSQEASLLSKEFEMLQCQTIFNDSPRKNSNSDT